MQCVLCCSIPVTTSVTAAAAATNRKGKRSALVDHHMKNKQHRSLMAEMDKQLRKVTIVSGMAQRLTNKVAIVTGAPPCNACPAPQRA